MTFKYQSNSNTPNILLKWPPHISYFLINPNVDKDGYAMLLRMGFWARDSDVAGFKRMYLPDLNKMTKEQQDKYLSLHKNVLNKPTKYHGQNRNGLPPQPEDDQD